MNKVFIVTSGSYSDYGISGVYSTREKAQEFIDAYPASDSEIEEWGLDEMDYNRNQLAQGNLPFTVWMGRDGDVERVQVVKEESRLFVSFTEPSIWSKFGKPMGLNHTVWAKDGKHAVKIVNEIRTQLIAEGTWV